MKKLLIMLCCACSCTSLVTAQSNNEDIAVIQSVYGKDKQTLVSQYMQIPTADNAAFWKLYDEYEGKRKAIGHERLDLLQQYAKQYKTLDDATASKLTKSILENNMKYDKLYESYFKKFSAIIGARSAAKFLQLELYLQTEVRMEMMDSIPFIDELDKQKKQH